MSSTTITTISGRDIDILDPDPDQICLSDITWTLSRLPRYNAHTKTLITIADHSVAVAYLLSVAGANDYVIAAGLLHDAHEVYMGDTPTPVKTAVAGLTKRCEEALDNAIADALGIPRLAFRDPRIKEADHAAYCWERNSHANTGQERFIGFPSEGYPLIGGSRNGWNVNYETIERGFRLWTDRYVPSSKLTGVPA